MILQKRILVPLGLSARELTSVHYALALAERVEAQVIILQQTAVRGFNEPHYVWLGEVLLDLINSARQAGLNVSHHIANGDMKEEIIALVKSQGIDLLVFGVEDRKCEQLLIQIRPLIPSQIIQVKEREDTSRWQLL